MKTENELLLHIYESADMGIKSTTKLLDILKKKDNKIIKEISSELKEYERIYKEAKKLVEKNGIKKIGGNIMANITASATMSMEIDKDNSDAKIADILLRGYTMGIITIEKKIENYKNNTDRSVIKLAEKLKKFQEQAIEDLKHYL